MLMRGHRRDGYKHLARYESKTKNSESGQTELDRFVDSTDSTAKLPGSSRIEEEPNNG